jgi:hypothetical protein
MRHLEYTALLFCFVAGGAAAQTATKTASPAQSTKNTVNNSRSNIKNNLAVSEGSGGKLVCAADGKPCTEEHVKQLSAALAAGKSEIKSVTLAGPDGALNCGGKPCTPPQMAELNRVIAVMKGAGGATQGVGVGLGKQQEPKK